MRWNLKLLMGRLRISTFKPWKWHYFKKEQNSRGRIQMDHSLSPSLGPLMQRLWKVPEILMCASLVILRQFKLFLHLKNVVNLRSILAAIGSKTLSSWIHLRRAFPRNVTPTKMVMMKFTSTSKDTFHVSPAVAWLKIGLYTQSQLINIGQKWDSSWICSTIDSTSIEQ